MQLFYLRLKKEITEKLTKDETYKLYGFFIEYLNSNIINEKIPGEVYIFTDGNYMGLNERRYADDQPIQANFYPVSSLFVVPDYRKLFQLNFITSHSLGVRIF